MGRGKADPERVELGGLVATPMKGRGLDAQGRPYWRVRRLDESREQLWTGRASRAEVSARIAELMQAPTPARPSRSEGARTVGDLFRLWVGHQEARHAAGQIAQLSLDNYRRAAGYWRAKLDDVLLSELSRVLVEDTLTAWLAEGGAPRTCRVAAGVMAAAVRWGSLRGHCRRLDLARLAVRVDEDEHVNNAHTPTRLELGKVLERLPAGRNRDLVLLLALTGARIGEAVALRVGDYDPEARTLTLNGRDEERQRKGKVKARRWPVAGELLLLVQRLTEGRSRDERLVEGLPYDCSDLVCDVLEGRCKAAGVPRFTAHGLRRMVAMELLEVADPRRVSELTGHSVSVLLRYYVRPRADDLRDLVLRSGITQVERRDNVRRLRSRAQMSGTAGEEPE